MLYFNLLSNFCFISYKNNTLKKHSDCQKNVKKTFRMSKKIQETFPFVKKCVEFAKKIFILLKKNKETFRLSNKNSRKHSKCQKNFKKTFRLSRIWKSSLRKHSDCQENCPIVKKLKVFITETFRMSNNLKSFSRKHFDCQKNSKVSLKKTFRLLKNDSYDFSIELDRFPLSELYIWTQKYLVLFHKCATKPNLSKNSRFT